MSDRLNAGNGHGVLPPEIVEMQFPRLVEPPPPARPRRRPLWPALILFLLTVTSTLAVGAEFAQSYADNREPFSENQDLIATMITPYEHPSMLLLGVPFSFTLLGILFTHEMGHYVACKIHGIDVSYPYFIPAPTLIGTFGAFIRIRSPITTRRALFDVGLSGPVAGFVVAVPAMAWAVATSRVVPGVELNAPLLFGNAPITRLFIALFHPHVDPSWVLLSPVGRAAWVGFFATALNLLPMWQLDGGHIVYSLTSRWHQRISLVLATSLIACGALAWSGWYLWGGLLLALSLRFRHPPVYDYWQPLDPARRFWAFIALAIFICCFSLWPVR
ncbi:MAG TPA: site-2 protease family protein [Candidatus Baltobacteraceae bacterium]|nr:site-2 protease family protein [Candidatus Baltobacteraceae bacterium]